MKKMIFMLLLGLLIAAPVRAEDKIINTSGDAILYLKALDSVKEKREYLLHQGKEFIKEEKYKDAREIANYILVNLDPESVEAKDLAKEAQGKEKVSNIQINPVTIPIGK